MQIAVAISGEQLASSSCQFYTIWNTARIFQRIHAIFANWCVEQGSPQNKQSHKCNFLCLSENAIVSKASWIYILCWSFHLEGDIQEKIKKPENQTLLFNTPHNNYPIRFASYFIGFAPCKRIRNPAIFCCWNPESRGLESGIHNGLESGIHYGMESGIRYVWISESRKLESGIQRPGSESRTFMDSLTWVDRVLHLGFWITTGDLSHIKTIGANPISVAQKIIWS